MKMRLRVPERFISHARFFQHDFVVLRTAEQARKSAESGYFVGHRPAARLFGRKCRLETQCPLICDRDLHELMLLDGQPRIRAPAHRIEGSWFETPTVNLFEASCNKPLERPDMSDLNPQAKQMA